MCQGLVNTYNMNIYSSTMSQVILWLTYAPDQAKSSKTLPQYQSKLCSLMPPDGDGMSLAEDGSLLESLSLWRATLTVNQASQNQDQQVKRNDTGFWVHGVKICMSYIAYDSEKTSLQWHHWKNIIIKSRSFLFHILPRRLSLRAQAEFVEVSIHLCVGTCLWNCGNSIFIGTTSICIATTYSSITTFLHWTGRKKKELPSKAQRFWRSRTDTCTLNPSVVIMHKIIESWVHIRH